MSSCCVSSGLRKHNQTVQQPLAVELESEVHAVCMSPDARDAVLLCCFRMMMTRGCGSGSCCCWTQGASSHHHPHQVNKMARALRLNLFDLGTAACNITDVSAQFRSCLFDKGPAIPSGAGPAPTHSPSYPRHTPRAAPNNMHLG